MIESIESNAIHFGSSPKAMLPFLQSERVVQHEYAPPGRTRAQEY